MERWDFFNCSSFFWLLPSMSGLSNLRWRWQDILLPSCSTSRVTLRSLKRLDPSAPPFCVPFLPSIYHQPFFCLLSEKVCLAIGKGTIYTSNMTSSERSATSATPALKGSQKLKLEATQIKIMSFFTWTQVKSIHSLCVLKNHYISTNFQVFVFHTTP